MTKVTTHIDGQMSSRDAANADARHAAIDDVWVKQAGHLGEMEPLILHNPVHQKIMSDLVRPPGYYESRREETYDRDQQRAQLYAENRMRLLKLIDETDGDSGGQPWSRERIYVR